MASALRAIAPGSLLLDAGCGDGRMTEAIVRTVEGARVLAIDSDADEVRRAGSAVGNFPNVTVRQSVIGGPDLGQQFDAIVCTDVLEHVDDDRAALRWLVDHVRTGGVLVMHVPASGQRHAIRSVARAMEDEVASGAGPHLREGYTPDELVEMARSAGLVDVRVEWTFHAWATRLATDLDTWTFVNHARAAKLALLPLMLAGAAAERAPSRVRKGNGLLLVGGR